jgi:YD repeat-containing protein
MKRATSRRFANAIRRALEPFRPHLETLEERLPPGDAFLSGLMAGSLGAAGYNLAGTPAATAALTTPPPSARGTDYLVSAGAVPAGSGHFQPAFAAAMASSQESHPTQDRAVTGRAWSRPVAHHLLELDPNVLDSLLGDDWDVPAASKPRAPFQTANPEGVAPAPTFLEGGGSAGPGSKDQPATAPAVQPATPAHGDIVPFSQQGEVPPDNSRTPPPPGSGGAILPVTPPEDDDCNCNSSGQVNGNMTGSAGGYDTSREFSDGPVRYFDGTVKYTATDIQSSGFGVPWGVSRTWTNGGWASSIPNSVNGSGITVSQQPFLMKHNPNDSTDHYLVMVVNGWNYHYFQQVDVSNYYTDFFANEYLIYRPLSHDFLLTDSRGDHMVFYDLANWPSWQQGKLRDYADPAGNHTTFTYNTAGFLTTETSSITIQNVTTTQQFTFTYYPTGNNANRVASVSLQRQSNGSQMSTIRTVNYVYYNGGTTGGDAYGLVGDLRSATITDGAQNPNTLDVYYYRYYTTSILPGYGGGLKYVFSPQSYARLKAAGYGGPLTTDVPDSVVQGYADLYLEYNNNQQVAKDVVQGQGCACGSSGGQGTYTFTYSTSSFAAGFNNWYYKTVETLPDSTPTHTSQNVVYANYYGQAMLKVYQQGDSGNPLRQPGFHLVPMH